MHCVNVILDSMSFCPIPEISAHEPRVIKFFRLCADRRTQEYEQVRLQDIEHLDKVANRLFVILLHVHILDIRRANPQRLSHLRDVRDYLGIILLVLDVLRKGWHAYNIP